MSRAGNVTLGILLIANVWLWMAISTDVSYLTGWGWLMLVFKILTACFITGPIYREYLR